jgi:phage shock protein C
MTKKLYRDTSNQKIGGVCAGIAEYFKIDPTVVRLAWAIFCCMGGSGIPAYIIAMIIMPVKPLGIE